MQIEFLRFSNRPAPALKVALSALLFMLPGSPATAQGEKGATVTEPKESFSIESACEQEVIELHRFFEAWFLGDLPDTDEGFARFAGVMGERFRIVSPSGAMTGIDRLGPSLRGAHGAWASDDVKGRIWIENVDVRILDERAGLCLVTYEEWQEKGAPARGRRSSAVLKRDTAAVAGLRWLHVHETWLPSGSD